MENPPGDGRKPPNGPNARLVVEINYEELISGPNLMAAEWIVKHGEETLRRFWPELNSETGSKISLIAENAFLKKAPFSEIVTDIRDAGNFSEEHPRPIPTDMRKPECPYCQKALKKIPGAKTKCPKCGLFSYVRTRPDNSARVVVTEVEAHRIDEEWKIKLLGRARDPDDIASIIARTLISMAQVGSNLEGWKLSGIVSKIKWLTVGRDPCQICLANAGLIREIGQAFPSGHSTPLAHPDCTCILGPASED